jgi:uncharacterized damage-inducible protein DinB
MTTSLPQPEQPGHSVLAALFAHNTWASLKLLDFCAGLNEEQLAASTVGGYGSIRDTLRHLVRAEVRYAERVRGRQPANPPPENPFPSFEVLREAVRWTGAELLAGALAAHTETIVTVRQTKAIEEYALADLMAQALSHATEHRTQVLSIITALGQESPDLSGWGWMEERGALKLTEQTGAE